MTTLRTLLEVAVGGPITYIIVVLIGYYIYELCLLLYRVIRNFNKKNEIYNETEIFKRDIDCNYSPAIASILYYGKIKWKKDVIANIINLYCKGILDIEIIDKKINYKLMHKKISEANITESDEYLIEYLAGKDDKRKFNYNMWKKKVRKEFERLNFTNKMDISDASMILIIICISIIATIIFNGIDGSGLPLYAYIGNIAKGFFSGFLVTLMFTVFCKRNSSIISMNLNSKGKEELKKWIRIKNFMEEYTLIKDKEIENVILYEEYLPYSLALGINKKDDESLKKIFRKEEIDDIKEKISEDMDDNPINFILRELGIRR